MDQDQRNKLYRKMADTFIDTANTHCETVDNSEVGSAMLFATSRFSSFIVASHADSKTSYEMMLLGFLYSSYSSFLLLDGKYFSAVSVGKKGLSYIEKAKELDKSNYDLYYYLGFFSYARGELKKRVPILSH